MRGSLRIFIFIFFLCSVVRAPAAPVSAQSAEDPWEPPVNLSHSGGTTNPTILADSGGLVHVLWEDSIEQSTVYSRYDGQSWSDPVVADLPFGASRPTLVAGQDGIVHAFWIDAQDRLFYSRVKGSIFGNPANWEPALFLGESALDVDAAVDAEGTLHVVYVRPIQTEEFPAGVYYLRSRDGGFKWGFANLIYQSPYFRSLTRDNASVGIASSGVDDPDRVYVVWDNRPRKQVLLSISQDAGTSWDDPVVVDKPDETTGSVTPYGIRVAARQANVILIWQSGEPDVTCTQFYQSSNDGGQVWSERQLMLAGIAGCPQDNQFLVGKGGFQLLMTIVQGQLYLVAWNGEQWSDPQPQPAIDSFLDPETFDAVSFSCRQGAVLPDQDRLFLVGCDAGSGSAAGGVAGSAGGGDIWLATRAIGAVEDWYPPPSNWSKPVQVVQSTAEILSPVLVADHEGFFHAFWSQQDPAAAAGSASTAANSSITYTRWDEERWSQPIAILRSPEGDAAQPAVTVDAQGRILVVWVGGQSGEVFFSWANSSQAGSPLEWARPQPLPSPKNVASAPSILVDQSGVVYVAYAIPFNAGRGIYLTSSKDAGLTWSEAVKVFDAEAAGWEMVDQPQMAAANDGTLHLVWRHTTILPASTTLGLYYAYSIDGGQAWSEPVLFVDRTVTWSWIAVSGENTVHRLWQENRNGNNLLWSDLSVDGGRSWNSPAVLSSVFGGSGLATMAQDRGGGVHLFQAVNQGNDFYLLKHSLWDGATWQAQENVELGEKLALKSLQVVISPPGIIAAMFASEAKAQADGSFLETLNSVFSLSALEASPPSPQPAQTPVATPTIALLPTSTTTPIPTPTIDLVNLAPPSQGDNSYTGLILGSILGGALIVLIFGIRWVWLRSAR